MFQRLTASFNINKHLFKNDALAGITVALALIPEAIAFAFVAGVSPLLSLQTAVIVALVAALFTGRPGMISASTAAIAVVFSATNCGAWFAVFVCYSDFNGSFASANGRYKTG